MFAGIALLRLMSMIASLMSAATGVRPSAKETLSRPD
jgi:hypothetical protein